VGLIARALEAAGIATTSLSVMLDITRSVKPPRAAFLDFPPGHTSGPAHDATMQKEIVRGALECLVNLEESGTIRRLPLRWPRGDAWKRAPLPDRLARTAEPQYQTEADRRAAGEHSHAACPMCVIR
jgi:hypothetical protein